MKKARMLSMMALVLVLLIAAVPAVYADPNPGEGNTDVTVVNTNQNTSASPANVTAIYYNPSGNSELTRTQSVASRGSYTFLASDAQLGDNWNGSMVVQSDAELAAVATIHYTGGSFGDRKEADAYTGYAAGSTEMYLPYIAYYSNQYSVITVQNTEDTAVTIQMTYINRNGGVDFQNVTVSLPGLGSASFPMNTPGQNNVPNLTQTPFYQQQGGWLGSVKIVAQGGKKIAAVASNHRNQWSMAYNGLSQASQISYIPSAERRVTGYGTPNEAWSGFSLISAQCVSTTACNVKFEFMDQGQVRLTLTKNGVAPGASVAANTRAGGDFQPPSQYNVLGVNGQWAGSVRVSSTNGTNLAVISESTRPSANLSGATSSATVAEAGRESFLPAVYQKNSANQSCPANASQWQQWSLIRIQNPGTSNASNVTISYFNLNGSLAHQETGVSIPAGQPVFRNTRNDCASLPLGGNWTGSVYVQSAQPLVTVVENLWGSSEMAAYNGYSVNR